MRLTVAAICDYALVSRDGKLSMMGLFSRVSARKLPAQFSGYIAFEIQIPETEKDRALAGFPVRVACYAPSGEEVFSAESELRFRLAGNLPPSGIGRVGQALRVGNVALEQPGVHTIRIWLDGVLQVDREVVFEVEAREEVGESAE